MSAPATQAYLLGIREGRALLRQFRETGVDSLATFREALETCEYQLRQGFAGEMRDALRGERDFWRAQVRRLVLED